MHVIIALLAMLWDKIRGNPGKSIIFLGLLVGCIPVFSLYGWHTGTLAVAFSILFLGVMISLQCAADGDY